MKNFGKALVAVGLLLACGVAAAADVAYNVGVTSDYRFRGVSQSKNGPAVQGGVDFSDKSGVYLGIWGSTIDFGSGPPDPKADLEVDLYGGIKFTGGGIDWDLGMIHYAYPGSAASALLPFTEIYFGGAYGPVFVKYYYADRFTGSTESAYYLTAGASIDLGSGFSAALSAGVNDGNAYADGFTDYKVGVSKDFAGFGFDLSYVGITGAPKTTTDVFNSESKVVLTVTKGF